jgi:hypothetical protein
VLRWWSCHGLQSLSCLFCPYLIHQKKTPVRTPDFHLMRPNVAGMNVCIYLFKLVWNLAISAFFMVNPSQSYYMLVRQNFYQFGFSYFTHHRKTGKKWTLIGSQKYIQY